MIKNYFKIAFRNLTKNKLFSGINIAGLTLGATCFLMIVFYVLTQFQYDKHHQNGDSLYRVETHLSANDDLFISATLSPPILPTMQNDFPEIANATRVVGEMESTKHIFKWNNNSIYETKGYYVDSTFFSVFDYAWVEGKPEHALQEPFTIVLTKKVKDKLFGSSPALGETIEINNTSGNHQFKVTGVVDASAYKSHIRANFYMAMRSGGIGEFVTTNNTWSGNNFIYGYIQLHPETDPKTLASKLPAFLNKHGGDQLKESGMEKTLSLQYVPDIHLHSLRQAQLDTMGNFKLLKILLLIAAFILLIACVNFMNLSTAKSLKRSVEVGIRKTIGADRGSIIKQFYIESFLVAGISFALALLITSLLLTSNLNFIADAVDLKQIFSPMIFVGMIGVYVLVSLIAGSYPALYLSSFKPVAIIKGIFKKNKGQDGIRKGLVVLQFTISIIMIIGSIVILKQLNYMQGVDLGFDQSQKIVVPFNTQSARELMPAFKNEVRSIPGVESLAGSRTHPGEVIMRDFSMFKPGQDITQGINIKRVQGDEDFLETLGIQLLRGRKLEIRDTSLIPNVLINQTALKAFEIPEDKALGQKIMTKFNNSNEIIEYNIVGVVKDYHQNSLKNPIRPAIVEYTPTQYNFALLVKTSTTESKNLISSLEKSWNKVITDSPFEYHFLDEKLQSQYKEEIQMASIINIFTCIAIFISCLGLFGLSVFIAEQRTKEIGIRKILGASTISLVVLLSKDFIKLIGVALLMAIPIAWYFMEDWLQNFAYRINIHWAIFLLTGLIAIGIGLMTVGVNSLKAALSNPVESIKND